MNAHLQRTIHNDLFCLRIKTGNFVYIERPKQNKRPSVIDGNLSIIARRFTFQGVFGLKLLASFYSLKLNPTAIPVFYYLVVAHINLLRGGYQIIYLLITYYISAYLQANNTDLKGYRELKMS